MRTKWLTGEEIFEIVYVAAVVGIFMLMFYGTAFRINPALAP